MTKPITRKLRCAVYTRKSTEEGLEQEFNSLHAQREACEAYVASQRSEGWALIREAYDDGGFSGGTLERPGLKRLLADIEAALVDVVVIYKIDRLSRSLMDFSKLVEAFDRNGVTFVSVTQSFNTTTSMAGSPSTSWSPSPSSSARSPPSASATRSGRRGRRACSWAATSARLRRENRKLVVSEPEAAIVRSIFDRFVQIGSATVLARELRQEGVRTKRNKLVDKGYLYKLLTNRTYLGLAVHTGTTRESMMGQRARDPRRQRPHPIGEHSGADAGAAEGADLRADRRRRRTRAKAIGSTATTSARTC